MGSGTSMTSSRPGTGDTYYYTNTQPPLRRRPTSLISEREEENNGRVTERGNAQARSTSQAVAALSESQKRSLKFVLSSLEGQLNVTFNHPAIVGAARVIGLRPEENLLVTGDPPKGLFVVEDGVLQVLSPSQDVVLAHLMKGDVCGELSALLNQSCSATLRSESNSSVIKVPMETLRANVSGRLSKEVVKGWCVKRSYIDTHDLFPSGFLMLSMAAAALKGCPILSNWSTEALHYIASLCTPVLFSTGEVIAKPGEPASCMFVFARGSVEVSEERSKIKKINYSEESFTAGEQEFIAKIARKQKIRAVGPLITIPVSREVLLAAVEKFPSERDKLQRTIMQYRDQTS